MVLPKVDIIYELHLLLLAIREGASYRREGASYRRKTNPHIYKSI